MNLQHIRPPCPSPTPRACSKSCPSSQWYHPTSSSSVEPFSPAFNLSQHQGLFTWVSSLHQVAKVLEFQLQHQSFQWIFRTDFLYNGLVVSPCSPRDSQESSPRPPLKTSILCHSAFFIVQFSHPYMTTGKTITLTRWTFVCKVMSLHFNMLSSLVITFLPRNKCLLILWLQSPPAVILEPKKLVCHCFLFYCIFPHLFHLCIMWPKYWGFSFSLSSFNEYSGLISFRVDLFDLLVLQGTLKSLLQKHNLKALILQCLWSNSHIHTWLLEKP